MTTYHPAIGDALRAAKEWAAGFPLGADLDRQAAIDVYVRTTAALQLICHSMNYICRRCGYDHGRGNRNYPGHPTMPDAPFDMDEVKLSCQEAYQDELDVTRERQITRVRAAISSLRGEPETHDPSFDVGEAEQLVCDTLETFLAPQGDPPSPTPPTPSAGTAIPINPLSGPLGPKG